MTLDRTNLMSFAAASTLAVAALALAVPAGAQELISIPVSGVHRGAEGTTVVVASASVPAELVGQTCQIVGQTVNQRSVHPGNDLLITTNGRTFVIPDFEDAGDITHDAGDVASVGETIQLSVRFGPDGASSGGFKVSVTCDEPVSPAPDTTAPDTTAPETTGPETTVTETVPEATVPDTTVPGTAAPDTTVADEAEEPAVATVPSDPAGPVVEDQPATTTVTTPATSAPATSAPAAEVSSGTTSTDVAVPRTTNPAAAPAGPAVAQLPVTGAHTWWMVSVAAALVATGTGLLRRSNRVIAS